jgi:phosphoglycolate phosphatase-like HAD superfamily hydrolase
MLQAIIFDFDGVLVNSNEIKKQAYFDLFSESPERDRIIKEALKKSKIKTRWEIIEDILVKMKEASKISYESLEEEKKIYVAKYSELTETRISSAGEIAGSNESLQNLSRRYPLFLVSGTTQDSLDRVVQNRELGIYFKKVYGTAPCKRSKIELIKKILYEFKFDPKKIISIGDAEEDLEAANFFGINFIGVINSSNDFEERKIPHKIGDLRNLDYLINEWEERKIL